LIRVTTHNDAYELDHTKTFSITYDGILTLTGDVDDLPDGIEDIQIDEKDHTTPSVNDLYVIGGELDGNDLQLTLSDLTPVPSIDMSKEFAWGGDNSTEPNNEG
jgi:hypothetical protein